MTRLCGACGGETFGWRESAGKEVLCCAACGAVVSGPGPDRVAVLERELAQLREDLNRLRQAVNFLSQRVR